MRLDEGSVTHKIFAMNGLVFCSPAEREHLSFSQGANCWPWAC